DAERILAALLSEILLSLQDGRTFHAAVVDQAALYGVRLAAGTGKGSWVDYVVELYTVVRRPCPATLVDELHNVLRKIGAVDLGALRSYLALLRDQSAAYGPAERFPVQRIEGLARL